MAYETSVAGGAEAFAAFEQAIREFKTFDMRGFLAELYKGGVIGFLEYQTRAAAFEATLSDFEARTFRMHSDLTTRAQELGIDLPQPRDGSR